MWRSTLIVFMPGLLKVYLKVVSFLSAPKERNPVVQRAEYRVAAVNARYSALNSSAGSRGLLFGRVNFNDDDWWNDRLRLARTAETSHDNSFASYHVLNYADDRFPTFLRADTVKQRPHDRADYPEHAVTSYQTQADIRRITTAALQSSKRVRMSDDLSSWTSSPGAPSLRCWETLRIAY